jgi:hypothetical protein
MALVRTDVPSSLIIFILKMEAIRSSETSFLTRAIWHHIPEKDIMFAAGLVVFLILGNPELYYN